MSYWQSKKKGNEQKGPSPVLSTPAQLLTVLGRDPRELVGQPETSWLDFKDQPYLLDKSHAGRERECLELAKDVTALANAQGGMIVLGVKTEIDASRHEEIAKELRPIPAGKVNPKQLQDVIWSWVQPKLDVEIQSHPVGDSSGELWSILVQPQQERDRPFIVAGEFVGEAARANRNLFGVYVRVGSQNSPYPTSQVQQWIHEGWKASTEEEESSQFALAPPDVADPLLADDVNAIGADPQASYYFIQAAPAQQTRLQRFFRGAPDSMYDRLFAIPYLRAAGFHLPSAADGLEPERTQRGALRVVWPGNDSLSVTPDGLVAAIEGQEHLTWAFRNVAHLGEIWINPIALVEFTLEFWRFYFGQVQTRIAEPGAVIWRAGMHSLTTDQPLYLPSSFVRRSERRPANADEFKLDWTMTEESDPERLAFEVLAQVYALFGFAEEIIPWAENRWVSEKAISEIRRGEAVQ